MTRMWLVIGMLFLGSWAPPAAPEPQESELPARLEAEVAAARHELPPLDEEGFAAALEVLTDQKTGAIRYRAKGAVEVPEEVRRLCEQVCAGAQLPELPKAGPLHSVATVLLEELAGERARLREKYASEVQLCEQEQKWHWLGPGLCWKESE